MNKTSQAAKSILNEHANIISMVKAIAVSYLITIPLFAIFALLLLCSDFPEKFLPSAVITTTLISIVVAGWTSTSKIRSKGWLNGGIIGLVYMLVLYLVSSLVYGDYSITPHVLVMLIIGVVMGSIGGILGINLRKEAR